MYIPEQYQTTEELERFLGDPSDPTVTFSFQRAVALDDAEAYPEEFIATLNAWGLPHYHIPVEYGGKLASLEQLLSLGRSISRRDLTVAIATGVCFLGSVPVWLAGTDTQRAALASLLMDNQKLGFALSERDHGHDILANELAAVRTGDSYRVTGEKWTIGHATRARALVLYARTRPEGGPRGFSLFLLDKQQLDPAGYAHIPKLKTLGLRGHDLSGIRLEGALIPADWLIGPEGAGLELATKSLLITRTMCAGLALGAADTALRVTVDFARHRILYGQPLLDLPHVRSILVEAFVELLISDCLATGTVRAWHLLPDQMSVWAVIVKYFVPSTLERTVQTLPAVLGSRFFLREDHAFGIFQKIYRDIPIVSVFEGSSYAQLHALGLQLRQLLKPRPAPDRDQIEAMLEAVFRLDRPVSGFPRLEKIELHSHGQNLALQGMEVALEQLGRLQPQEVRSDVVNALAQLGEELVTQLRTLSGQVATVRPASDKSPEYLELARRYAVLHTAAVCLHIWLQNRQRVGGFFERGEWLVLALRKLLRNEGPSQGFAPPELVNRLAEDLTALLRENRLFAVVPVQLGRGSGTA